MVTFLQRLVYKCVHFVTTLNEMSYKQINENKLKCLLKKLSIELDDWDDACFPDAQIVSLDKEETYQVTLMWPRLKVINLVGIEELAKFVDDHKEYFRQK